MQSKRTARRAEGAKDWPSWKQLNYCLRLMCEAAEIDVPATSHDVSTLIDR